MFCCCFLIVINVFHRGLYEPFSRGGGGFQRKPKATCDFPGGGPNPLPPPPSGSAHVCICFKLISELSAYHNSSVYSITEAAGITFCIVELLLSSIDKVST